MGGKKRDLLDQLTYSYAYAYGYPMAASPLFISLLTGQRREKGVRPMNIPSPKSLSPVCGKCGAQGDMIEPLFDLDMASALIPMRYPSLKTYLSKNKEQFPARYMLTHGHRRIRLLTGNEIKAIRAVVLRGPGRLLW